MSAKRDELRERGLRISRRLAAEITAIAPEGIGRWDPAWQMVDSADAEYWAALKAWEEAPSRVTAERVRGSYEALLGAWRMVAAVYSQRHEGVG